MDSHASAQNIGSPSSVAEAPVNTPIEFHVSDWRFDYDDYEVLPPRWPLGPPPPSRPMHPLGGDAPSTPESSALMRAGALHPLRCWPATSGPRPRPSATLVGGGAPRPARPTRGAYPPARHQQHEDRVLAVVVAGAGGSRAARAGAAGLRHAVGAGQRRAGHEAAAYQGVGPAGGRGPGGEGRGGRQGRRGGRAA